MIWYLIFFFATFIFASIIILKNLWQKNRATIIQNFQLEKDLAIYKERNGNYELLVKEKSQQINEISIKELNLEKENLSLKRDLNESNIEKNNLKNNSDDLKKTNINQQNYINDLHRKIQQLEQNNGQISFENNNLKENLKNLREEILQNQEMLKKNSLEQFENLANKILEEKSKKFVEFNFNNIQSILNPLGQDIETFKKQINELYSKESRERFGLEKIIKEFQENSNKVSKQANDLVNALKGSSKKQGNWGEMILEKILQDSGLIKNIHYFREKTINNEEGKNLRPDFQIFLPDQRIIIIDSKVSLIAYDKYCSSDHDNHGLFIDEHLKSIYNHIDNLSQKKYDDLNQSLDFTMMFFPVEPAYLLAIENDFQLWSYAYQKRILLISPTNLIACLKLINDLWKREVQSRNAQTIVDRAEKLYEKLVNFTNNFEKIGEQINILQDTFYKAQDQFINGKGNIISQAIKLKDLGLKSEKIISKKLLDQADIDSMTEIKDEEN